MLSMLQPSSFSGDHECATHFFRLGLARIGVRDFSISWDEDSLNYLKLISMLGSRNILYDMFDRGGQTMLDN